MSVKELKDRPIEGIRETDDPAIIDHLYKLLELELDLSKETVYKLSPEEEAALDEAEQDILHGRLVNEKDSNDRIQK